MSGLGRVPVRQILIGLLMLPLSLIPFGLYLGKTQEGGILWAKVETSVAPPQVSPLPDTDRSWATAHAPDYEGAVALLVYHGLGSGSAEDEEGRFTITPDRFAEQLATLEAAGMNTVTAQDVALAFAGHKKLPPNAVMISFDDGRTDAMLYADPILEQLDMQASMFVISERAAQPGIYYVGWESLRAYAHTGRWDIQSHTSDSHREHIASDGRSLPVLTSLSEEETPERYAERVQTDLRNASLQIEGEVGIPPLTFAYPFGAYGGRYDDRKDVPDAGRVVRGSVTSSYVLSFNQDDQASWGLTTCSADPHRLRRLEVGSWSGRELLGRISSAAAELTPPTCDDAYHSGRAGAFLDSLPGGVRARVEAAARFQDTFRPQPLSRVDAPVERLSAATGDATGACEAWYGSCVGLPEPPIPLLPGLEGVFAGSPLFTASGIVGTPMVPTAAADPPAPGNPSPAGARTAPAPSGSGDVTPTAPSGGGNGRPTSGGGSAPSGGAGGTPSGGGTSSPPRSSSGPANHGASDSTPPGHGGTSPAQAQGHTGPRGSGGNANGNNGGGGGNRP